MKFISVIVVINIFYFNFFFVGSEKCCSALQVHSSGWSKEARAAEWGVYDIMDSKKNDGNVYKHRFNNKYLHLNTFNYCTVC
jgi:hypothetical protein